MASKLNAWASPDVNIVANRIVCPYRQRRLEPRAEGKDE
jgi:hypothetical protein